MQMSFEGEAERSGLKDEDDVVALVKEIRKERGCITKCGVDQN